MQTKATSADAALALRRRRLQAPLGMRRGEGGWWSALATALVLAACSSPRNVPVEQTTSTSDARGRDAAVSPPPVDTAPSVDIVEADTAGPPDPAGTCGPCAQLANAEEPACRGGRCAYTCKAGFGLCGATPEAGCLDIMRSPEHCGACGRSCRGGTCNNGRCEPVRIAGGLGGNQLIGAVPGFDGQELFFADPDATRVVAISKLGGILRTLQPGVKALGLAVLRNYVYWAEPISTSEVQITRLPKVGGLPEAVVRLPIAPGVWAFTRFFEQGLHLYWRRDARPNYVYERTQIGSGRVEMLATGQRTGVDPGLVDDSGVTWVRDDAGMELARTSLAGGAPTTFHRASGPVAAVLGADDRFLYWAQGPDAIYRMAKITVTSGVPAAPPSLVGRLMASLVPLAGAVVFEGERLFVFGAHGSRIVTMKKDGSEPVRLMAELEGMNLVTGGIDAQFVYWLAQGGTLYRVPR